MRTLYFRPVTSYFFSSPNLSGRRLDVYHTSTHGVALVQIQNAGLNCTARGSLKIQDAKNRHIGTIAQLCRAISSQLIHILTIGKKLLNSNTSSICPHNMENFGPLTAEICWRVWGSPANFNGFRVLAAAGRVTARHSSSGHHPKFGALNTGRHLYSAGRPSRWALAHILVMFLPAASTIGKSNGRYKITLTENLGKGISSALGKKLKNWSDGRRARKCNKTKEMIIGKLKADNIPLLQIDTSVFSWLRTATRFARPVSRTKKYCSFITP